MNAIVLTTKRTPEIIAAGPWVKETCCLVRRIVIQDNGYEYVVSTEAQDEDRPASTSFHHGTYFRKSDGNLRRDKATETDALRRAWKHFDHRSKRLMGLIGE